MKYINLTQGFRTLIDDEDFDKIMNFNKFWHIRITPNNNYAVTNKNKSTVHMHRIILDAQRGAIIDHINGNGLDNRKCNLRICTKSQNLMNSNKPKIKATSIFKGVCKLKKLSPGHKKIWRAEIRLNKKGIFIGNFYTEIEAAKAYNSKALELFGQFAKVNKV